MAHDDRSPEQRAHGEVEQAHEPFGHHAAGTPWQFSLRGLLLFVVIVSLVLSNVFTVLRLREVSKKVPPPPSSEARTVDEHGSTAVVEYYDQGGTHYRAIFVRDENGLHPLDLTNLTVYLSTKHGYYLSDKPGAQAVSPNVVIRDFVRLHNPRETILLKLAQDIPKFSPAQLDPDIRGLPLTPLSFKSGNEDVRIIYTWTKIGGVLKRYRFLIFHNPAGDVLGCESCATLQSDVGAAEYLK
jgi:hypothetical protein